MEVMQYISLKGDTSYVYADRLGVYATQLDTVKDSLGNINTENHFECYNLC